MLRTAPRAYRRGLSLIELLVVVAIVGILIGLLLPAVQAAREASRQTKCRSNLRQIGIALHAYHDTYRYFPTGCTKKGSKQLAWSLFLLPHLEQEAIWRLVDMNRAYSDAANKAATSHVIPTYICPSTTRLEEDRIGNTTGDRNNNGVHDPGDFMGVTDYGGVFGVGPSSGVPAANGVMLYDRSVRINDIRDGTSETLIVAENTGRGSRLNGEWANGENIFEQDGRIVDLVNRELDGMWSDHPHGVMALYCDGSVHYLHNETSFDVLKALCTRAGGERIDEESP